MYIGRALFINVTGDIISLLFGEKLHPDRNINGFQSKHIRQRCIKYTLTLTEMYPGYIIMVKQTKIGSLSIF